MYDAPWAQAANDRLWRLIRTQLTDAPAHLTRNRDLWDIWQSPDLYLSQTCGLPFRAKLYPDVALVGTPDHGLPNCPAGHYYSVMVKRKDDNRDLPTLAMTGVMAYNEPLSQSGWAAPIGHLSKSGLSPSAVIETGGHIKSAEAVINRRADYAALDAITFALYARHNPQAASQLWIFDQTEPTPALPYITAGTRDPAPLFDVFARAIDALDSADRRALHLQGIVDLTPSAYTNMPLPPAPFR